MVNDQKFYFVFCNNVLKKFIPTDMAVKLKYTLLKQIIIFLHICRRPFEKGLIVNVSQFINHVLFLLRFLKIEKKTFFFFKFQQYHNKKQLVVYNQGHFYLKKINELTETQSSTLSLKTYLIATFSPPSIPDPL